MIKRCFVPGCANTSKHSRKVFLSVPVEVERRKKWFSAVNIQHVSKRKDLYCCEDHFDLEDDAVNWMFYKTIGKRLVLKADIVPHKFPIGTMSILTDEEIKRKAELLENLSKRQKIFKQEQEPIDLPVSVPSVSDDSENVSVGCLKHSIGVQTNLKRSFKSIDNDTESETTHFGTCTNCLLEKTNKIDESCLIPMSSSSDAVPKLWEISSSSFRELNVCGSSKGQATIIKVYTIFELSSTCK